MLAGILLTAVLCRTALADPEASQVGPVPAWSIGLAFTGHGGAIAGVPHSGLGPTVDVALGAGRTQYFVEGGPQWISFGTAMPYHRGFMLRGALGARYIARSFEIGYREGAVEMLLEGTAGAQKIWIEDGDERARPELGIGVGLQLRKYRRPQLAIRMSIRLVFTPGDEAPEIAARTTQPSSFSSGGFLFSVGGAM
jgi:hypothetical protein